MTDPQYKNPIPVAVGLICVLDQHLIKMVGVVRSIAPVGGLALPGGYTDHMESIEQAVSREVFQEIGLKTGPLNWRLMHSRITENNRVLVFCELMQMVRMQDLMDGFIPNDEVSSLVLLDENSTLCFPLHQEALAIGIKRAKKALSNVLG